MIKSKFNIVVALCLGTLIVISGYVLWKMNYVINRCDELVYPGISINEVDISYLNKGQAIKKVSSYLENLNGEKVIKVQSGEKTYETDFESLGVKDNLEEVVDLAIEYGKGDSFFKKYRYVSKGILKNFKTQIELDDNKYEGFIAVINKEQNRMPVNALIEHDWSGFKIIPHELGRTVDTDGLKVAIKEAIDANSEDEIIIVSAEFITEYPRILEEDLKTVDSAISSYTTSFGSSSSNRCTNIEVAARYLDDIVVMPGEEFSFNKTVGAATSGKGFQYSKGIRNGVYVDEIGGGVCQVSSTLYNALLKIPVEITERRNHSKAISYVPMGRDAMISYGSSDLKFINTFEHPIVIEAIVQGKQISFNLYSNSQEKKELYTIITEKARDIKPNKEIVYDYNMSSGASVIEQKGRMGYVINTYRVLYKDGREIKKILVDESIYPGKNIKVRIGKR